MITMRTYLLLILSILAGQLSAQTDFYDQLKTDYDRLRKEEKHDSALTVAKQMNAWVLKNETDTSLRYAVSSLNIGRTYNSLQIIDSSKYYLDFAITLLEKQDRITSVEYTDCLSSLAIILGNKGNFKEAEQKYLMAIDIRNRFPTQKGHKPKYLNNLGFLYVKMGMYEEAETVIRASLKRFEELYPADTAKFEYVLHSLAMVYHKKEDYKQADEIFVKWYNFLDRTMLSKAKFIGGAKDVLINDLKLGKIEHAEQILSRLDLLVSSDLSLKNTLMYDYILFAHGKFEMEKKKFDNAEKYFTKSIQLCEENNFIRGQEYLEAHLEMGALFLKEDAVEQADLYVEKAQLIAKEMYGIHHPNYAVCLRQKAKLLMSHGFYKEAVDDLLQANEIMEEVLGVDSKIVNEICRDLGIAYRKLGLYKSSENYSLRVLDYFTKNENRNGEASALNNLGYLYIDYDKLELAKELISKSLQIRVQNHLNDTSKYYSVIHSLAKANSVIGLYDEAKIYYVQWWTFIQKQPHLTEKKMEGLLDMVENFMRGSKYVEAEKYLNIADSILGANSAYENAATGAYVQKVFGDLSIERSRFDKAIDFYTSSETKLNNLKLTDSKEFSEVMKGLAKFYLNDKSQNLEKSLDYVFRAAEIQQKKLGSQHTEYANTLHLIGIIYSRMAMHDSALYYYNAALDIKRVSLGEDHSSYASTLNNIALVYVNMGAYERALPIFEKVLIIKQSHHYGPHKDVASIYCNLAGQYQNLGKFNEAEEYFSKGLNMRRLIFDPIDPAIASVHLSLSLLYMEIADYKNAEKQLNFAGEIWQKRNDISSVSYAEFLLGLAKLFIYKDDKQSSVESIQKALSIYENIKGYGRNHPKYAFALNELGRCYLNFKNFEEAEKCFLGALEIRLNAKNRNYFDIAKSYRNLGDLFYFNLEYVKADSLLQIALQIADSAMGCRSILSNSIKVSLARNYYVSGNFDLFIPVAEDLMRLKLQEITRNFEWFNDYQRELYWKREKYFFEFVSEVVNSGFENYPQLTALNYDAILILKGQLLEAKISKDSYLGEVEKLKEEISLNRKLMAKMESDGTSKKLDLENLNRKTDSLDNQLSKILPGYFEQKKNLVVKWQNVQHNLDIGEVAIEFIRVLNTTDSMIYYNALILSRGQDYPQLVKVCGEAELNIWSSKDYAELYDLIWRPIEPFLEGVKEIYYSPIGKLDFVPFHALYARKGSGDVVVGQKLSKRGVNVDFESVNSEVQAEYLIDRYTLHQLTSTRYLAMGLKEKSQEPITKSIALVGGVNYDFLNTKDAKAEKQKGKVNLTRSGLMAQGKLGYLKGTATETETIKYSVQSKQWKIEMFSSNVATEDNIVRLEGRHAKSILHIATHGYAFPNYDFSDTTISENSLRYSYRYSTNPMVRSGLILAGGNWAWTGSDTLSKLGAEQNGILTALEVSQLNLKNTKLVVLSACETGLGKIEGSEGTFGLKRGFKLAGVEQMIVSLWSVPDKETMELMTLFYTDLTTTLNPVVSFEKAQKQMRMNYPTEPDKWAGFVLVR
jgi:tetratricopeptide (TPR) repeat protein/CHAT domain-containing protein